MKYFMIFLILIGFTGTIFASDNQIVHIEHYQPDVELLPDNTVQYGESFTIHAWLPIYDDKPDELQYFVDVLDSENNQVDSTLWFAKEDFVYEFNTTHPAYHITKGGTYFIKIEKADQLQRTGSFYKTLEFKINFPQDNLAPLKQFKSGIKFHNVECNEGLVLAQRGNSERSACVTLDTKIELTIRGWADDDRLLLGCIGERVQKCYPEDKEEYRKKLQRYYYGFNEEPDSEINVSCMKLETSKEVATFFKVPSYLPDGYSFKCSFSGTPYESYLIFDNKKVPDGWISHYPELVSDGAIFIHQTDEKRFVGEKKFATYGTATQRIQDTYDEVMLKNPSLQPQLIRINGMLAYAVDSCNDCGVQTANFTDGTIIQKSTSTEAKIKFIDENGTSYLLKAGIPLNELIKVAESLQ